MPDTLQAALDAAKAGKVTVSARSEPFTPIYGKADLLNLMNRYDLSRSQLAEYLEIDESEVMAWEMGHPIPPQRCREINVLIQHQMD